MRVLEQRGIKKINMCCTSLQLYYVSASLSFKLNAKSYKNCIIKKARETETDGVDSKTGGSGVMKSNCKFNFILLQNVCLWGGKKTSILIFKEVMFL